MPQRHELIIEGHMIVALEYNAHKAGTPAFLIHGIMSSVGFWSEYGTIFHDQFHWYSLSLPGHYPAVFPAGFQPEDLTAEMIVRVLTAAIRQLVGEQQVVLFGHSSGGFAALAIAAQSPEMVRAVVSVAGFARGKWGGLLGLLQWQARIGGLGDWMFLLNLKSALLHPFVIYHLSSLYSADKQAYFAYPKLYPMMQAQFVYAQHLDTRAMLYYFKRMPHIDISEWLPRITAPTLVITGDKDPIVPPAQATLIADKVPQAKLVTMAGSGHMVMWERTVLYTQVVNEWLRSIVG